MTEPQKTHNLRAHPGMSANRLADYMAASEQGKRSILKGCKYQPRARVIQHLDAKESIAEWLSSGDSDTDALKAKSASLRSGLAGSDFDNDVAEHNADYIDRFLESKPSFPSKAQEAIRAGKMLPLDLEGFSLSFSPEFILKRVNKLNTPKMGVAFLRYSKGKALDLEVACWQGAISMGYLTTKLEQGLGDIDPERDLCAAIDVWTGKCHVAPGNAVYRFKEVRAACAAIVERWENIAPPENAVY